MSKSTYPLKLATSVKTAAGEIGITESMAFDERVDMRRRAGRPLKRLVARGMRR